MRAAAFYLIGRAAVLKIENEYVRNGEMNMKVFTNDRGQAIPEGTVHIGPEAFGRIDYTEIRWLAGGGAMINSRGTVIMLDPVLEGFDMPLIL